MRKVYLDNSATTRVRPEVAEIVTRYMTESFGNPSSLHSFGRENRAALDQAREQLAAAIGAETREVYFTGGGTESDNLAVLGVAAGNEKKGKHIVTSTIEHHAVLDCCKHLEKNGFEVTYLPAGRDGIIAVEDFEQALREDTILASIMHVNNEVGTIQNISAMSKIARSKKVLFHTDAIQSFGKIEVDVNELDVDLLSVSGHKIYGPKGVGALYIRRGARVLPRSYGGSQERRRRPGTENLPGIIGFGLAAELAVKELEEDSKKILNLRERLVDGILNRIPHTYLNGHREQRIPGNANISIQYIEGEGILLYLDMKGVAISTGSACTSGTLDPSHVLTAMDLSQELAHGSLRMTPGRENSEEDIDYVLEVLPEIVDKLRAMSPFYKKEKSS